MIKKIILLIVFFIGISITSFSIGDNGSGENALDITISGAATTWEGSTETYYITFISDLPAASLNFVPAVTNGNIVFQNMNPLNEKMIVQIQWLCKQTAGALNISETTTGINARYTVVLLSSANSFKFCTSTSPSLQYLSYGQIPTPVTITNCSPFCTASYDFQYQWQMANITSASTGIVYANIPGAVASDYQPPTSYSRSSKLYRRITTFIDAVAGLQTKISGYATVHFGFPLNPGTISGIPFVYLNSVPTITQTAASQGYCDPSTYIYSWERTTDGSIWEEVSTGENYSSSLPITATTQIRRKITCGSVIAYTNILTITIATPLYEGELYTLGNNTFPFNSIPVIYHYPATGGLCLPANYVYTWERSVENAAWEEIGTGVNYPATAGIVGNSRFRRKVTCAAEVLYSNLVIINMSPYISPNFENLNYVRVNNILVPNIVTWPQADNLTTGKKIQSTIYYDGLGRPTQKLIKEGSFKQTPEGLDAGNVNNYQDIVEIYEYDALGRSDKSFLPYATSEAAGFFKINAHADQQSFTNTKYGEPVNSEYVFYKTVFDGSPLNRPVNVKLPGAAINTNAAYKGISNDYELYKTPEIVKAWKIGYNTGDVPVIETGTGKYEDYTLVKNITRDEKDKMIIEYKDFLGNTILKKVQEKEIGAGLDLNGHAGWLNTYYVFDDFNRLRYTITPKAVAQMDAAGSWIISAEIKAGLCFYQEYDKKGRVIVQHSPDAGEVWMVYDNRNRLVFTQDEKQRNRVTETPSKPNQWSFSLYDDQDRVLVTGLINDARNRLLMQDMVNLLTPGAGNKTVDIFTGSWQTITAYNPVAGKIPSGGYYCQSCTESITNSVNYFDEYNYFAYQPISAADFAPVSGAGSNVYLDEPSLSLRVKGVATSSLIRVLNDKHDNGEVTDDTFLATATCIDEKGRVLQTHSQNIKMGFDVLSVQYDFAGKVFGTNSKHDAPGSNLSGMITVSKNEFDLLGRQIKLSKVYVNSNPEIANLPKYKHLSTVLLDEFGRIKTKKIGFGPVNPNNPIETQDFSYNIQGWLTGINKDYALADNSSANQFESQWKRRFGMYLGYENASVFSTAQFNGNISGVIWRSQGDNTPRKYNYEYDNLNRFTAARFTQKETLSATDPWLDTKVNLSSFVNGYDANGNIQNLQQTGIIPGTMGGVLIDNLQYQYYTSSNKLKSVQDNAFAGSPLSNGKQGDFKDYTPADGIDYAYDKNGNLEYDKNKNIIDNASIPASPARGIINNFLDLPQKITIKDKSTTEYIYDAAGAKLAKTITFLTATPADPITTYYLGEYIYENDEPKYILHEEGKLRLMEPVTAWSEPSYSVNYLETQGNFLLLDFGTFYQWAVWDYHIKDNLGNTRMVLTEEFHLQQMKCSMEDTDSSVKLEEEQTFGQQGAGNEVSITRVSRQPTGWPDADNATDKVSRLINQLSGGYSKSAGPNALLKVMAGDELTGMVKYFYQNPGVPSVNTNILTTIVGGFINAINTGTAAGSILKDNNALVAAANNGAGSPLNNFLNSQQNPGQNSTPKAYLNILFFDEQFRYVGETSAAAMIAETAAGTGKTGTLVLNKTATKNGYVYIYLSNESTNTPVYFDDMQVSHKRGPIVEDNAYYPFGLKIQGISARAALKPKTKEGYQGAFNEFDEESGYNEFLLRSYDAQIGRFIQKDPYDQFASGYIGMGNDAVNNIDPSGGWIFSSTGFIEHAAWAIGGAVAGAVLGGAANGWDPQAIKNGAAIGGGVGLGASSVNWSEWAAGVFSNPEFLRNVVIFIGKEGDEYAKQFNNKDEDKWHIIVKNNITDANKALQKYRRKKSLNNILLETHGTESGNKIIYDGEKMGVITQKKLEEFTAEGIRYPSILGLQAIGNSLKTGGNLVLTACNLAKQGKSTLEEISKLYSSSINIYGSNQFNNSIIETTKNFKGGKIISTSYSLKLNNTLLASSKFKGSFFMVNSIKGKAVKIGDLKISSSGTIKVF